MIDYKSKFGTTLWSQGTKPLEVSFDMSSNHEVVFIKALATRAKNIAWSIGSKSIFTFVNYEGNTIDLIHEYGQISMKILRQEYQKMSGTGYESNTRMAKITSNAKKCLVETLTS